VLVFMPGIPSLPTEAQIIINSQLETLYNHEFERGRYFQVVFSDENETHIRLAPRTMMKVLYIRDRDDIEGIEILKCIDESVAQRISFSKFNLSQLRTFLSFINQISLSDVPERRLKLNDNYEIDETTVTIIKTILLSGDGGLMIEQLIAEGVITSHDIVNTAYRKQQLAVFNRLLVEPEYLHEYRLQEGITDPKEEKVWQYFFEKNSWILGYGLDYRFMGILQREFHASTGEANGSNGVISDYLMGDKRFTTFVELKKPSTPLFSNSQNRSNSWRLSNDLFYAVSQILEQKASGVVTLNSTILHDSEGNRIEQNAYDSKVILIVGRWDEINQCSDLEKKIKQKTFELFRRDSRNIEIITYDELYERAQFIVDKE
jgi:hypothetical protein